MLAYHRGQRSLCVDLGCGHGVATRALAPDFSRVIGVDPSPGMVAEARSLTPASSHANVEYHESAAEHLPFLADDSVDMVVAAQSAHWFDYPRLFAELKRTVRRDGTLAVWGYRDHIFVDHPNATAVMQRYCFTPGHGLLGDYWPQPGRSIAQFHLHALQPPESDWTDIRRDEYEPSHGPPSGNPQVLMTQTVTLAACKEYIKTWSAYHAWREAHPPPSTTTDIVDDLFDHMRRQEDAWKDDPNWMQLEVRIDWGSTLILARRKDVEKE